MWLKRRLLAAVLTVCMLAGVGYIGLSGRTVSAEREEPLFGHHKDTLYLWYTDEALTDFLNSSAVAYGEENEEIRVLPVLTSGLEYLEEINKASLSSDNVPDLYIISNDSLEKAYLSGLATEIDGEAPDCGKQAYPDAAIRAASYRDKVIGYPFYFETSALLYNRTYLEEMAHSQLQAEADAQAGEEAMQEIEAGGLEEGDMPDVSAANGAEQAEGAAVTGEQVEARVQELLPSTIDDILSFANSYDAPEQVEAVFKWDVTDIFYNYFFVGSYMDVGGPNGDDPAQIDIYNEDAVGCLKVYQDLNQFFSIDTKEISYDSVLEDFIEGKLVFTIATTDAVARLEEARKEGRFTYSYGIAPIPDINGELQTKSLSVTNCVAVNGYSEKREQANDFARFLTCECADGLYSRTGKAAARYEVNYGNANLEKYLTDYENSVPMPKMIETSNFWVQLEIAFSQIWDGAPVNERLRRLSEQIMTQVKGEPYTEEVIEEPDETEEQVEYLDEEYYRREALTEENGGEGEPANMD